MKTSPLFEVEKIINGHPQVLESAAYAIPSELGEDEVMVAVVLQPGAALQPLELMQYCEEHMAYLWCPAMSALWTHSRRLAQSAP